MWKFMVLAATVSVSNVLFADAPAAQTKPVKPPQIEIPVENQKPGKLPDGSPAEDLAKNILKAVQTQDLDSFRNLYFPEREFIELKAVAAPKSYFDGLIKEYQHDVSKLHALLQPIGEVEFVSFKRGFCKWKDVGSEYNSIAYWSCYNSKLVVSSKEGQYTLPIRTLINWGPSWYVTHLGHKMEKDIKVVPKP